MTVSENEELILDGTKIQWHMERVAQWERGERIAPITIDMALTELVTMDVIFVMLCCRKMIDQL